MHKYTSRRRNEAYEKFNNHNAPIPTHYLRETLGLIFQETVFQFNEENGVICQYFHSGNWNEINPTKRNQAKRMETLHWWLPLGLRQRRSRWFIKRANYFHPSIKFTAEISENQLTSSIPQCLEERDSQNPLQGDRDLPVYALRLVPPTRR